jgi:hypothetical protein
MITQKDYLKALKIVKRFEDAKRIIVEYENMMFNSPEHQMLCARATLFPGKTLEEVKEILKLK